MPNFPGPIPDSRVIVIVAHPPTYVKRLYTEQKVACVAICATKDAFESGEVKAFKMVTR